MKELSGNPLVRLARNLDVLIEEFKNHCVHFPIDYSYGFCKFESEVLYRYIRLLKAMYHKDFVPCSSFELKIIERVLDFNPKIYFAQKSSEMEDSCPSLF